MKTILADWVLKIVLLFALGLRLLTPSPAVVPAKVASKRRARRID